MSANLEFVSDDILETVEYSKLDLTTFKSNVIVLTKKYPEFSLDDIGRFVIARKNDMGEIINMINQYKEKKATIQFPIVKSMIQNEFPIGKMYVHGVDKEGRPLLVWVTRLHNYKTRDLDEVMRLFYFWTEHIIQRILPSNKSKYSILIDRSEHGDDNSDTELVKRLSSDLGLLYPERMRKCIVYPVNWFFTATWNIVKYFLDPITRDKIVLTNSSTEVSEHIDKEFLPASMKGTSSYVYNADEIPDFVATEASTPSADTTESA